MKLEEACERFNEISGIRFGNLFSPSDMESIIVNKGKTGQLLELALGMHLSSTNLDFEDGYSDFNFVSLYIYNILSYALFNYKKKIDYQVMLNTLKGIEQIPLSLKIDIANFVIKELKLFYLKHPFSSKIKIHQKRRIIQFPKEDFN